MTLVPESVKMMQMHQTVSGYDHNYILPGNPGEICYAAAVRDPESRRIVEVFTDMPGVQLYTAKELVEQGGKVAYLWKFRWFML